jgi:hypothetical protein
MNRPIFRLIYGKGLLTSNNVNIYTVNYKYDNNNILQYPFGYISYPINVHTNIEYTNFNLITECNLFRSSFSPKDKNIQFIGFNKNIINSLEHNISIKNNTYVHYFYVSTKNYEKLLIKPFL